MSIRILPPFVVNRIAAGEVVERPASVVKELVENAIDAKATRVHVTLHQGGRNLIRIQDNGKGMSRDDLPLALERHATSKLDDDTLLTIQHFGFRGEALPTIASVSRLSITSRQLGAHEAWRIEVEGGLHHPVQPASLHEGTIVEVCDLFYATPARLKFLKSEKTELQHIQDLMKKFALVHPTIHFELTTDQGTNLSYPQADTPAARLAHVLGKDIQENMVALHNEHQNMILEGFAGLPTLHRKSAASQFFFVNQRPINSRLLQGVLRAAYQDVLSHDFYPACVLFLTLSPEEVDVNVHPAKTEVRFRDEALIRNLVFSSIRNTIKQQSHQTATTVAQQALHVMEQRRLESVTSHSSNTTPVHYERHYTPSAFQTLQAPPPNEPHRPLAERLPLDVLLPTAKPAAPLANHTEAEAFPLGAAKCQLHQTYIVAQTSNGLVIVDQHAAHERITLEKLKQSLAHKEPESQRLLIPEIIDADAADIERIMEIQPSCQALGLIFERFGDSALVVKAVPAVLKQVNPKTLILNMIDEIKEHGIATQIQEDLTHRLATYACHHSIRAGRSLSIDEMNALLREMESTPMTGQCNHGRPTYIALNLNDIERLFGRIE